MTEKLLTTAETCQMLGFSRWRLRKWEDNGDLTPIRTSGGHRRFKETEIKRIMGVQLNTSDNQNVVIEFKTGLTEVKEVRVIPQRLTEK